MALVKSRMGSRTACSASSGRRKLAPNAPVPNIPSRPEVIPPPTSPNLPTPSSPIPNIVRSGGGGGDVISIPIIARLSINGASLSACSPEVPSGT